MQITTNSQQTKLAKPDAFIWLSDSLLINAKQSIPGDAKIIADLLDISDDTVREYLKGEVRDLETGKKVLTELKRLISGREKSVRRVINAR